MLTAGEKKVKLMELIDNKRRYMVEYKKVNGKCLSNFITKANWTAFSIGFLY